MNVGIVGIGFMGMIHYLSYQKVAGANVTAMCDADPARREGDWTGIKGNFGPTGTQMDLTGIRMYDDAYKILDDPDIDLVDICLPPAFHADVAVAALEKGKHVFCEKPMALTAADAQRMAQAAEKTNQILLIGHVLPFMPEYAFANQAVSSGDYGSVRGGTFYRIISDPTWVPDFYNPDRVGGPMLDLHIHDAHLIRLLFGMPTSVQTSGRMRGAVLEYFNTQFSFEDPSVIVDARCGIVDQACRPFTHGFELQLEEATLIFHYSAVENSDDLSIPLTVLKTDGEVVRPALGDGNPVNSFASEIKEVVACITEGRSSKILAGHLARDAVVLCHHQTTSSQTQKTVMI